MTAPAQSAEDLYDHEVLAIIAVRQVLQARYGGRMRNYEAFEQEARERLAEIGFTAGITWHEYAVDGVRQEGAMPEITITGRLERREFDHDRQVSEATANVLGIPGEGGVIKTDRETVRGFLGQEGHGHARG